MKVKDRRTGKTHVILWTDELTESLNEVTRKYECKHEVEEVRAFPTSNGGVQIKRQCINCGAKTSNALPKGDYTETIPLGDQGAAAKWEAKREEEKANTIQRYLEKHIERETISQRDYETYITSPEWLRRRAKVLKRCGGICEGCLENAATQVHHLSYQNFKNEFMFELVAVCSQCHRRIHLGDLSEDSEEYNLDDADFV